MNPIVFSLIQAVLIVLASPLLVGIILKTKARYQNRRGASVFQPYWMLLTLCRKEMTVTSHGSWVFRTVPFVVLASSLLLAVLIPTLGFGGAIAGYGSVFLVAGVLAIGSMFLVFGGMDAASTFGAMGSSREMTLAALVEPAVVIVFATLGLSAQSWNLDGVFAAFARQPWYLSHPLLVLTFIAMACVLLAENARYPVDNPATHLELTMVHEAMILEYSGPYLAMLEAASAIKLAVLSAFFLGLLLPWGIADPASGIASVSVGIISLLARIAVAGILIATAESVLVKMRFYRMQEYMSVAYFLGLAGLVLALILSPSSV